MIKKYSNVLDNQSIDYFFEYFNKKIREDVWGSSLSWDQNMCLNSCYILTHVIVDNLLEKKIKNSLEQAMGIKLDRNGEKFQSSIYVWSSGSYISWHPDDRYPYNGTIYMNEKWDSSAGGIFLYKDNMTNEIKGIEPTFNSMVVNYASDTDSHSDHCVTCINPGILEKRITIQWRTLGGKERKMTYQ